MMRSGASIWLSGSWVAGTAGNIAADAVLNGAPAPAAMLCLTEAYRDLNRSSTGGGFIMLNSCCWMISLLRSADCSGETTAVFPELVTEHPVTRKYARSDSNKCWLFERSRIHLRRSSCEPLKSGNVLDSGSALVADALLRRGAIVGNREELSSMPWTESKRGATKLRDERCRPGTEQGRPVHWTKTVLNVTVNKT